MAFPGQFKSSKLVIFTTVIIRYPAQYGSSIEPSLAEQGNLCYPSIAGQPG